MSEDVSEFVQRMLDGIIAKENIVDAKITASAGSEKGDGYIGQMLAVEINGRRNGKDVTLNLMVKRAPDSDALRSQIPIRKIYDREIYVYDKLLPTLKRELEQNINNKDEFTGLVKCYATSMEEKNETLILQHLGYCGYRMFNRKEQMDATHIKLVFDQYAHFHAFGFALREQKPQLLEQIKGEMGQTMTESEMDVFKAMYVNNFENLKQKFADIDGAAEFLERMKTEMFDKFKKLMEEEKNAVFIHGDNWCNNMMFKYDEENNPKHVIILDWQMSRLSLAIADLIYAFYCNASQEVVDDYENMRKFYYNRLEHYVKNLGSNLRGVYSYEDFVAHWDEYRVCGFCLATLMFKVMVSEKNEAVDMAKAADTDSFAEAWNYTTVNEDKFLARLGKLLRHFLNT